MEEEGEWVALTLSCITYCTLSYEAVAVLTDDANCTFNIQVESRVSFFRGRQIVSRHGSAQEIASEAKSPRLGHSAKGENRRGRQVKTLFPPTF